ncbi:MAG TPA: RsmG family class I SAM-dependent methyltransferase [Gaiellaceae bacterium]|nr:RsmG family class I SAM-dependent methyltransferase [Gaiellaceae bacterium]
MNSWGNLPVHPDPLHGSADTDESLRDWIDAVLATPGLTAIRDPGEARAMLLDDALRALPLVERFEGPIVDVGSGGGSPGIPLAVALSGREVTLLEAELRKCEFLERWAPPNARVVRGRAEEQETDTYGVAVAKALAQPPVAAEWCLPLVRPGGAAILWLGPSADLDAVAYVASRIAGGEPEEHDGLVVVPKLAPTPPGFPRRVGVARKRPLVRGTPRLPGGSIPDA